MFSIYICVSYTFHIHLLKFDVSNKEKVKTTTKAMLAKKIIRKKIKVNTKVTFTDNDQVIFVVR